MRDGLYKVEFRTPRGAGAGVVHLVGGKLWGGDSGIYYLGTYSLDGGNFTAEVKTGRHSQNLASVFGVDAVRIHLQGQSAGDSAVLQGTSPDAPGISFQAELARIAD